eukprot:TRINITY_DN80560_c0_g1_i1.p1 TRINITY_DN80560_c0_g1~~TRINITY_DN80560_c0_g1_i1.p1  ORF type:complete len:399 (-),score=86.95 TRINITY_DN80560_c0_g1_i1:94-1290(-)
MSFLSWVPFFSNDSDEESEFINSGNIFEDYQVGDVLGAGAFGQVRKGFCRESNVARAVKIVDMASEANQAAQSVMSAKEEAMILRRVTHPYIAGVCDVYETDRFLYIVMELITGGELFKAIAEPKVEFQESDFSHIAKQLMDALSYLHKNNIVHRDVKAENLLLTKKPEDGGLNSDVKLIDFGLSAVLEQKGGCIIPEDPAQRKELNLCCGTPHYCAPEVWSSGMRGTPPEWKEDYGDAYGPKVDVWAAGVLIYLGLFGSYPYNGSDPQQLMRSSCSPDVWPSYEPAPMYTRDGYKVSGKCKEFLQSCLEKDQDDRLSAREALQHDWVSAGGKKKKTRGGLNLQTIPADLRANVWKEAQKAGRIMLGSQAQLQERPNQAQLQEWEQAFQSERQALTAQ